MRWELNRIRPTVALVGVILIPIAIVCEFQFGHFMGAYLRSNNDWHLRGTDGTFLLAAKWWISGMISGILSFCLSFFGRGWRRIVSCAFGLLTFLFIAASI
jgi:hypothetical protein